MSRSSFNGVVRPVTSSHEEIDETYDLRGLNLVAPDQVMPKGESPMVLNSRMYAREDGQNRVAIRTRFGSTRINTAMGETANVQNAGTVLQSYPFGDVAIDVRRELDQPFTPNATGAFTHAALELKKSAGAFGHVIIELWTDSSGFPGIKIAASSVLANLLTTSLAFYDAYFIDAPTLTSGVKYHLVYKIQDNGAGIYYAGQTATSGSQGLYTEDAEASWTGSAGSFRFKSYLSVAAPILGWIRYYPSSGLNRTIFAQNGKVISMDDSGNLTTIDTGISLSASFVRFSQVADQIIWNDGFGATKWFDGTTVTVMSNVVGVPNNNVIFQRRAWFVTNKTLLSFSDLGTTKDQFNTFDSTNILYIPEPLSPDPVTALQVFQDNLVVSTHETKFIISGSDLSSFTRREAIGTKGAVSQEATCVDRNYFYFMADDKQIYRYNGISDELISDKVQPELSGISNAANVRFHLYRNQLRVYYSKTSNTQNDLMLLLDLDVSTKGDFQWFLDSGRPVQGSIEWTQDDNQLIEFSSRVGALYLGEQQVFSDVGKAINWKYWTNYKQYGSGTSKKRVKRFRPFIRTVSADYVMQIGRDFDFADSPSMRDYSISSGGAKYGAGYTYGSGVRYGGRKLVDNKSPMSGRGRHVQYRFEREGVDTESQIYGYASILSEGKPR